MFDLAKEEGDAEQFFEYVLAIAGGISQNYAPKEFLIIRIDNWFDWKWLRFSGKVLGAAGFSNKILTVPPFVPSRVCWQQRYQHVVATDSYERVESGIHRYRQRGEGQGQVHRYEGLALPRLGTGHDDDLWGAFDLVDQSGLEATKSFGPDRPGTGGHQNLRGVDQLARDHLGQRNPNGTFLDGI